MLWLMLTALLVASLSITPVTVTLWAVFQFSVVKVRLAGDTFAAAMSLLDGVMVTSPLGWVSSARV